MKYENVIERISLREKISLIKNLENWQNSSIDYVKKHAIYISPLSMVLEKLNKYGISFIGLLATWDFNLVVKTLKPIFEELKAEGVNAVILQDTLLSQYNISSYVREKFLQCLVDALQISGIIVFVEIVSNEQISYFDNAFGFSVSDAQIEKIHTEAPVILHKNNSMCIYTNKIQLLSEDEILMGNRASHGGTPTKVQVSDREINETLDTIFDILDRVVNHQATGEKAEEINLDDFFEHSTVVIKNAKSILPLAKTKKYIIISSQTSAALESFLVKNGYSCKSITVDNNIALSPHELSGYDTAIVFGLEEYLLAKTCDVVKNMLLELVVIRSSKEQFNYNEYPQTDVLIETFASGIFNQKIISKVLLGEITDLGYLPFDILEYGVPQGFGCSFTESIQFLGASDLNNKLYINCKNLHPFVITDLITIKHAETRKIVGFAKTSLAAYEQNKVGIELGGPLVRFNDDKKDLIYVNGKYELLINDGANKFSLQVSNGKISVAEVLTKEKTNQYKLPVTKSKKGHGTAVLLNIVLLCDIIMLAIILSGAIPFSVTLIAILFVVNLVGIVGLDAFLKKNHGLGGRIVKTNDKPVPFDEIFNSKPEKTVVKKEEIIQEQHDNIDDAIEIDFDVVDQSLDLSEQEKVIQYLKEKIDINNVVADIKAYLNENGLNLERNEIKNLVAAMAANHTILVKTQNNSTTKQAIEVIGNYFNSHSHIKDLDANIKSEGDIIKDTKFISAVKYATIESEKIAFAGLNNFKISYYDSILNKFKGFIKNHKSRTRLNDNATLEKNLWLFAILDNTESVNSIPEELARNCIVINLDAKPCQQVSKVDHQPINYYQFMKLINDCKRDNLLQEEQWKKIDDLETYTNNVVDFHIGNKMNFQIENYTSVQLACETDIADSLDLVVAQKLLPIIIPAISKAEKKPEIGLLEKVEKIFGEENIVVSLRTIKSSRLG